MKTYTAIFISVISGLLLGVSINFTDSLWFLSLISIIPFFYVFDKYIVHIKQAFLFGWLFGSAFLGTVLMWFWQTLPLDWLGVNSALFGVGIVFISWASLTVVLALFFGLTSSLFYVFRRKDIFDIFLIALIWVFLEYLRMWGYALLTFGSESLFGPHFSVGFVGYALASNQTLLQLASIGGVYLLSAVVVFINALLYLVFFRSTFLFHRKIIFGVVFLTFILLLSIVPFYDGTTKESRSSNTIKVVALQTNFPPTSVPLKEKMDVIKLLFEDIRDSNENPDIVVLPEDMRFIRSLRQNNELDSFMSGIFGNQEVLVIDSSRVRNEVGAATSRIEYYNTKSGVVAVDEKQFLMPYGEYTPSLYRFLFKLFGQREFLAHLDVRRGYVKGDSERVVVTFKEINIGALFCSEILSPSLYKTLVQEKSADILVNLSSQSWFHGSYVLYRQTKAIAKVHAVQNNRYFVQASNSSPSFILNNRGDVVTKSKWGDSSVIYNYRDIN